MEEKNQSIIASLKHLALVGSENEKVVISYIFDHINNLEQLKASDIAENCYVSKSFISKFVKKFDYNNFYDFRHKLNDEIVAEDKLSDGNNYKINSKDVTKLSEAIKSHNRVFIFGEKFSKIFALHMYYRLLSSGVDACLIDDILFERRRVQMDPDSLIIILCKDELTKSASLYIDLLSLNMENIHVVTLKDQEFKNVKHIYRLQNHSLILGDNSIDTTIPVNYFIEMVSASLENTL